MFALFCALAENHLFVKIFIPLGMMMLLGLNLNLHLWSWQQCILNKHMYFDKRTINGIRLPFSTCITINFGPGYQYLQLKPMCGHTIPSEALLLSWCVHSYENLCSESQQGNKCNHSKALVSYRSKHLRHHRVRCLSTTTAWDIPN